MVEYNLFQLLVNLLRFSQDNITLSLDGLRIELRVLKDIGEDIDSCGYVCIKGLGIVYSVLTL